MGGLHMQVWWGVHPSHAIRVGCSPVIISFFGLSFSGGFDSHPTYHTWAFDSITVMVFIIVVQIYYV